MPAVPKLPPRDPRWPTAGEWLAAGPGRRPVDVTVLGVPTFATSLTRTGAHGTPRAVRRELQRLSTWCASRRVDLGDLAPLELPDVEEPDQAEEGEWRVRVAAGGAADKARLAIILGGDRSATYPAMRGACDDDLQRAGLVTLAAHHGNREGRSNSSPVRNLIDAGLDPERVAAVGIADWAISRSYADEAHARGISTISRGDVESRGMSDVMAEALEIAGRSGSPVYVALDLGVCDRPVAPACPGALPGGLSARELLSAAYEAGRDPRVIALDITEVDAAADRDGRTVRLAALALLEAVAGLAMRPVD